LQAEQISFLAVVAVAPDVSARRRLEEANDDPQALTGFSEPTDQKVPCTNLASDLASITQLGKPRRARHQH
jgi:hypothetical protein